MAFQRQRVGTPSLWLHVRKAVAVTLHGLNLPNNAQIYFHDSFQFCYISKTKDISQKCFHSLKGKSGKTKKNVTSILSPHS